MMMTCVDGIDDDNEYDNNIDDIDDDDNNNDDLAVRSIMAEERKRGSWYCS